MSKTGAIFIRTDAMNFSKYNLILNKLVGVGWSSNKCGNLFYMVNNSFDWIDESLDNLPLVMSYLEKSINDNQPTCLDLVFLETSNSIGLNYLDDKTIMFSISENIRMLEGISIIDFSWYMKRLAIVFEEIDFFSIECHYS